MCIKKYICTHKFLFQYIIVLSRNICGIYMYFHLPLRLAIFMVALLFHQRLAQGVMKDKTRKIAIH